MCLRDSSQYLPYNYSVAQSFRQDGDMGWNPYTHNGTAIAENTMLCPGDWHHVLYFFLPCLLYTSRCV